MDFAFRIHSDVGEHLATVKVNGKIVPVSYKFQNGDICSVTTRPQARPSLDWISLAKSSHARSKIKHYFRRLRFDDNVELGRTTLLDELSRQGLPHDALKDTKKMTSIALDYNKITPEDLFAAIGFGDIALGVIVNRLRTEADSAPPQTNPDGSIIIPAKPDALMRRKANSPSRRAAWTASRSSGPAAVCRFRATRSSATSLAGAGFCWHREECPNIIQWRDNAAESQRLVSVDWQPSENSRFETGVVLESVDRMGLLRDVTEVFSEMKTFILSINTKSNVASGTAIMRIDYQSSSTEYTDALIRKLRGLSDMLAVYRLGLGAEESPQPVTNTQTVPAAKAGKSSAKRRKTVTPAAVA